MHKHRCAQTQHTHGHTTRCKNAYQRGRGQCGGHLSIQEGGGGNLWPSIFTCVEVGERSQSNDDLVGFRHAPPSGKFASTIEFSASRFAFHGLNTRLRCRKAFTQRDHRGSGCNGSLKIGSPDVHRRGIQDIAGKKVKQHPDVAVAVEVGMGTVPNVHEYRQQKGKALLGYWPSEV